MLLSTLLAVLDAGAIRASDRVYPDPEVTRVVHDSRTVEPGDLFCCITGTHHDGHDHMEQAVEAGAVAVLAEHPVALDAPVVVVESVRQTMPFLAAAVVGDPSHDLRVVGVTGTNGKTSVAHMLAGVLDSLGRRSEAIGTLSGIRTTPEAPEFQRCLAAWLREGVECVVAEVSSHALAQHRVDGTWFSGVAFTNLGREHLDYHSTMEEYAAAKDRLFSPTFTDKAVIVVDDQAGRLQADRATAAGLEVVEVSTDSANASVERQRVEVSWRGGRLKVPVGGRFTATNVLVVAELALLLGTEESAVAAALASVAPVPGRFEAVEVAGGLDVVVDYAHTPGALAGLLESCRATGARRTILVFGCGGERDRGKRPLMGAVAEAGADLVLVTSDNPRGEPPREVIADILSGMERQPALVEPDRRLAIRAGLAMAGPDDLVVLAGRGHEATQEVDGEQVLFADREVAIEEAYRLYHGGRAG